MNMNSRPGFNSFADFMNAFVLPLSAGRSPHDRLDGGEEPGKRAPVIATFQYSGATWEVDGDTRFEPLLVAWEETTRTDASEPFCFRDTSSRWALALRPDLYTTLTLTGDRGAGYLFAYAPKSGATPELDQLLPHDRSGGELTEVANGQAAGSGQAALTPGRVYGWGEIADTFGFKEGYLARAGGMVVSRKADAVLVVTHPGGGQEFDYGDYWQGADLIYTGKGQRGDQKRTGANLAVATNSRTTFAFEHAGKARWRFLGIARCVEEWQESAADVDEKPRQVIRFRLRFADGEGRSRTASTADAGGASSPGGAGPTTSGGANNGPRPFNPDAPPAPSAPSRNAANPAEVAALTEKARQGHHELLTRLFHRLKKAGWTDIGEIPGSIDLWARDPEGRRVIFEAKTISTANELSQTRSGLAQLLEYRADYGVDDDQICLVCDQELDRRRSSILERCGVAVLSLPETGVVKWAGALGYGIAGSIVSN